MGTATKIEWCDHTASPWYGCSRVHTGCINCYAEALAKRNPKTLGVWGPEGTRVASGSFHRDVAKWHRHAVASGTRASVFPSLCDPFEDWKSLVFDSKGDQIFRDGRGQLTNVGRISEYPHQWPSATLDSLRGDLFRTIDACPMLDFMLLTKRPGNISRMWPNVSCDKCHGFGTRVAGIYSVRCDYCMGRRVAASSARSNVQLLYSASDQASLEAGIGELVTGARDLAPVLGLSLEPLIGPIDLGRLLGIDWVIVGGESGPHARPCNVAWISDIVRQCNAASVPVFVKQLGSNIEDGYLQADKWMQLGAREITGMCGKTFVKLNDRKGGDWNEWPADLRVREFPEVTRA